MDTPIDEALEARRGVCQDFAHIALALARAHGIPCRYVSGYLAPEVHDPWRRFSEPRLDRGLVARRRVDRGGSPHHQVAGERHIAVAVGRDYQDAAPTRGVFRGGPAGTLSVSVRIEEEGGLVLPAKCNIRHQRQGPDYPAYPRSD